MRIASPPSRIRQAFRTGACLAFLFAGGFAAAQQCVAPPPGRVYWLAADGDLDDRARYHNGIADGSVPFVPGKVGEAVNFDSDADLIATDVTDAEQKALENTFTWELWARPTETTPDCPEAAEGNCSGSAQRFAIFPLHGDFHDDAGVGLVIGTNAICSRSLGRHRWTSTPGTPASSPSQRSWCSVVLPVSRLSSANSNRGGRTRARSGQPRSDHFDSIGW